MKTILLENNTLALLGQAISLNGVEGGAAKANNITGSKAKEPVEVKRAMEVRITP